MKSLRFSLAMMMISMLVAGPAVIMAQSAGNPTTSIGFVIRNPQAQRLTLQLPASGVTDYTLSFPSAAGATGSISYLSSGSGQLSWLSPGSNGNLLTLSSGVPSWVSPATLLATSFVQYNISAAQSGATDRSQYLFNLAYNSGASDTNAAGAVIASTGGATNRAATGLAVTATASGTATATGITVCATGGANNYAAVFPCGSVGVGTSTPNGTAALDISSTSQGFLAPRMTDTQRTVIGSPATGLLVYQTNGNNGFYYYDGASWVAIHSDSSIGAVRFIQKPSAQVVNTALALGNWVNDNDLTMDFPANQIWEIEIVSFVTPGGLLGLTVHFGMNLTTGMSGAMYANTPITGVIGVGASTGSFQDNMASGANGVASVSPNALGLTGAFVVFSKGYVITGSSRGTVTALWRGSGLASTITVRANSYLKATRLK